MDGHVSWALNRDRNPKSQLDPLPNTLLAAVVTLQTFKTEHLDQEQRTSLACVGKILPMATAERHDLEFDSTVCTLEVASALIEFELDDPARARSDLLSDLYFLPIYERGRPPEPVGILPVDDCDGSSSRIGITTSFRPSQ